MISQSHMEVYLDLIPRVARFIAYDFPEVEAEDLSQDLWVWVLKNPKIDPLNPGVWTILTRQAKHLAWEVRKEALHRSPQYMYRVSDVRQILETVYSYTDWERGFCPADAKGGDRMGAIDVRSDVSWAIDHLPRQYRDIIYDRYHKRIDIPSNTAERRRLNRAIRRLTDILNTYHRGTGMKGHPGRRTAISNAQARAIIEDQE